MCAQFLWEILKGWDKNGMIIFKWRSRVAVLRLDLIGRLAGVGLAPMEMKLRVCTYETGNMLSR
jgi:hypothetical protein